MKDYHVEKAAEIFEIPYDEVTKEQRQFAKEYNLGNLYGNVEVDYYERQKLNKQKVTNFPLQQIFAYLEIYELSKRGKV